MGLYDRDYYRDGPRSSSTFGAGSSSSAMVVKTLIALNVAVFLLQIAVVREEPVVFERDAIERQFRRDRMLKPMAVRRVEVVTEWLDLDTRKVVYSGQIWRLITGGFCHNRRDIWHILINMLILYWAGSTLERMMGSREFLLFYLMGLLWASLAFLAMDLLFDPLGAAVGASGAVFAVAMLFTMHFPRHIVYLFFFIPIEMRWLMALYVLWDLHPVLLELSGDPTFSPVAHAAHLGGALLGFLYFRYNWSLERFTACMRWSRWTGRGSSGRPRLRIAPHTAPDPESAPDLARLDESLRLDEILEKISRSGQGSLTEEELAILRKASEELKNRRQRD
jgi:membrane associated rhomboid family serine protease